MSKVTATVPHSWSIDSWPAEVFPTTPSRARRLLRVHRAELIQAGALSRVGRELIVLGPRYLRWLELHSANVPNFRIAPNRLRDEAAA